LEGPAIKDVYFMDIWSILRPFGLFNGHLVYFLVIWYIFPRMGKLYQENLATLARNAEITFSSGTTIVMRLT
jgi:hypothetical protein